MIPEAAVEAAHEQLEAMGAYISRDYVEAAVEAAAPAVAAAVLATAIGYAEDQAMAGAYFPEWQRCADLLREMCTHRGITLHV